MKRWTFWNLCAAIHRSWLFWPWRLDCCNNLSWLEAPWPTVPLGPQTCTPSLRHRPPEIMHSARLVSSGLWSRENVEQGFYAHWFQRGPSERMYVGPYTTSHNLWYSDWLVATKYYFRWKKNCDSLQKYYFRQKKYHVTNQNNGEYEKWHPLMNLINSLCGLHQMKS